MNADTIILQIREALDEPNDKKEYWTNDDLLTAINAYYVELAWDLEFSIRLTNYVDSGSATQNAVASVADDPVHKMPSDYMKLTEEYSPYWLTSSTDTDPLTITTWREFIETGLYDVYNTTSTTQPYYMIMDFENQDYADDSGYDSSKIVHIYPAPSANGNKLKAYYVSRPTDLASTIIETSPASTATSPIFPEEFHRILIWSVVVDKLLKRRRVEEAEYYNKRYFEPIKAKMYHYYKSKKAPGQPKSVRKLVTRRRSRVESFDTIP